MNARTRVLVVGANSDEITALTAAVAELLPAGCHILTMQLDSSAVDPALAWGTDNPRVIEIAALGGDQPGWGHHEHPLADDGDTWKAIATAARRHDTDLIVMVNKHQRWLSRLFSGSAAHDLVTNARWPVLLITAGTADDGRRRPGTGRAGQMGSGRKLV